MRAVDANVLIYAFFTDSPFHKQSAAAVRSLAEGRAPWAIPWPCIHEFYAVVTNPKLFSDPSLPPRARAQITGWLASPSLQLLAETSDHWATLENLLTADDVSGPIVHDAKIAAICLSHRVTELLTLDRDFRRFPALKVRSVLD